MRQNDRRIARLASWLTLATLVGGLYTLVGALDTLAGGLRVVVAAEPSSDDLRFFENRVRPLLSKQCHKCHGAKKQEAGLRLDSRAALMQGGDHGAAIVPGNPEQSLLFAAVSHRGKIKMPPRRKLALEDLEVLRLWIEKDAAWGPEGLRGTTGVGAVTARRGEIAGKDRRFWSLRPITDAPAPEVSDTAWPTTDVDRFVLARLEEARLAPAPDADRRTWLRRVTFDLIGLPPAAADVTGFLEDESPAAFGRVVDRLLATREYGERWGRHWLDVVRYADTAGETADFPVREAYRYRNWVLESFAVDRPYDEFVRDQVAGDIVAFARPDDELRQRLLATGFIAISRRFGFDTQNYHNLTIQDTIDTLGLAVMGLSLGCARCHDHKFDPVTMRDYYALYGIFESTRYSFPGSEEKKRPADFVPVATPDDAVRRKKEHDAELASLGARVKALDAEKKKLASGLFPHLDGWIRARLLDKFAANDSGRQGIHVWRKASGLPSVVVNASRSVQKIPGTVPPGSVAAHPAERAGVAVAWCSPVAARVRVSGRVADAHDCGDSVAWSVRHLHRDGVTELRRGSVETNGEESFEGGSLTAVDVRIGDVIQLAILPKVHHGCDLTLLDLRIDEIGGEERVWKLTDDLVPNLFEGGKGNRHSDGHGHPEVWILYEVPPDHGDQLAKEMAATKPRIAVGAENVAQIRVRIATVERELTESIARRDQLRKDGPYELIFGAIDGNPSDARIQLRGNRLTLGDTVPRRFLEVLGGDALDEDDRGSGRQSLARWLTRRENPLTPRVIVNRIWQHHFGSGLVATENDFGVRGKRPSHPELLDWLASRFVEDGWSIKRLHRRLLLSRVYRASSAHNARAIEMDPENSLLWRFSRRRLDAESIRDSLLFVGGNLDRTVGGEHPFPPVGSWGFSQHNPFLAVYDTKRRSVYLMTQRLRRHPFLALFDGADTNASTAKRVTTTVPTQALFLMNSPFVHEQARGLARQLMAGDAGDDERVRRAYSMALSRPPAASEVERSLTFVSRYRQRAGASGAKESDVEAMAWSAFARTLVSANEFIFVD